MDIEKAFKKLLVKSPFYGLFCLSLPKIITTDINTLCVRRRGINVELCINPEFWKQFTDDEQIALLEHELSHICLQHMFLSESFPNAKLFNISADLEVNSYIEHLPEGALIASKFGLRSEQGTKYYYEELSKNQNQSQSNSQASGSNIQSGNEEGKGNQGEGQQGNSNISIDSASTLDDHSKWRDFKEVPEATKQLIQNNINNIIRNTAEQVQKQRGTVPNNLIEIIEKLKEKKPEIFNWKHYFRRLLGSIYDVNIRSTRRKESKRFEGAAGIQHKKKVSIIVAIDTSGSVSSKELQDFISEIDYIYRAGARITLIQCDSRINKVEDYDGKNFPEIVGRGGTDFNPPIEYYIKHKRDYASLIYFTDGECCLPDKHPSGLVWVITSAGEHQDYPGKTIYIPRDY